MAPDLLSTIRREIDERLNELRPQLAEYEQLLMASDALVTTGREAGPDRISETVVPATSTRRQTRANVALRDSTIGAIERATADRADTTLDGRANGGLPGPVDNGRQAKSLERSAVQSAMQLPTLHSAAVKPKSERAAPGAAREAILAALDHGSHTIGELVVVTAMSGPNINGNLRRLVSDGAVVKTEREGKTAYALTAT
jgi:hypothetical protein